jgi:hypothetical protein
METQSVMATAVNRRSACARQEVLVLSHRPLLHLLSHLLLSHHPLLHLLLSHHPHLKDVSRQTNLTAREQDASKKMARAPGAKIKSRAAVLGQKNAGTSGKLFPHVNRHPILPNKEQNATVMARAAAQRRIGAAVSTDKNKDTSGSKTAAAAAAAAATTTTTITTIFNNSFQQQFSTTIFNKVT